MNTRISFSSLAAFTAILLVTTASCSSSGAPNATTQPAVTTTVGKAVPLGPGQQRVVELTLASAAAQGVVLDERCFNAVAAQLSDADAQLIIDATPKNDTPTLSAQGASLAAAAAQCVAPPAPTTTTGS